MSPRTKTEQLKSTTKKCPMCAETIDAADAACRYCGTRFTITRQGYCENCHKTTEADSAGKCKTCGSTVIDIKLVSTVMEAEKPKAVPAVVPMAAPIPAARPTPVLPYVIATLHIAVALHFIPMVVNWVQFLVKVGSFDYMHYTQVVGTFAVIAGVLLLPIAAVFLYLRKKAGYYISVVAAAVMLTYLIVWLIYFWDDQLPPRLLIDNCIYYTYPFLACLILMGRLKKDFD